MVILTWKQLEKLTQEELIGELLTVNSIHEDLANLTSRFDEFLEKYVWVESELAKIKHVCHIEKALNMENIDSFLGINV